MGRAVCRRGALLWLVLVLAWAALTGASPASLARAASPHSAGGGPVVTVNTGESAGPALMGLGVEWDPYDSFVPTQAEWNLTYQRLDYMSPGFLRVVEPASDYFAGYSAAHVPLYRWTSQHVVDLLKILAYAQSRGITVVLGDWGDPLIHNDPRVPADFLTQLHNVYGFTTIRYYDPMNEPNYSTSCTFSCWTAMMSTLTAEFGRDGITRWLQLVGPDNGNSWDDTAAAQAADRTTGLDPDNPTGGDSWLTATLQSIPGLIGAYDSHRYATIWGIEHGVYEDQMQTRREEINNLDSPSKAYFEGELGLTARTVDPFLANVDRRQELAIAASMDPSSRPGITPFVDSQPYIEDFAYGVWMGDLVIQGIDAGLSGASAWDLDDAMHSGGGYGSQNLKKWGFWNSLGGQDGYPASDLQPRPWYYAWSVLARSFPRGSQPLAVPNTGEYGLRVAAVKIPRATGDDLSFAVVNDSDIPRSMTLVVPAVRTSTTLGAYDYFNAGRPVDGQGLPVPSQILSHVSLQHGLRLSLPSRGLVVLSSKGFAQPVRLSGGAGSLVDNLANWSQVYRHSRGVTLAHTSPAQFNYDSSRAVAKRRGNQYLIYRTGTVTSFALKAYYRGSAGLKVYGSHDGEVWTPVNVDSINPAPAIDGNGWYLTELFSATALRPGVNELRVELSNRTTQLALVHIQYG
jgi:hypothetical protein